MDNIYVILNANKEPTHKFKTGGKTWDEVKDFDNIGMMITEPYVVLDFDNDDDNRIMMDIVKGLGLKCNIMQTTRGCHYWFKRSEPLKNFVATRLAVGVYADCRSYGRAGYVKIKDNGKMRKWLAQYPDDEIEDYPDWLLPLMQAGKHFDFKEMGEGSGRNQELYSYIAYMQSNNFSKDIVIEAINIINDYVLAKPLPASELKTILRDEAFLSEEKLAEIRVNNEKFKHNIFAEEMIANRHILSLSNKLYSYEDGYYQPYQLELEQEMIKRRPDITKRQREEVLSYLRVKTAVKYKSLNKNPYIINCINTRVDIKTGKLLPFEPESMDFERIPVIYDADAYDANIDKLLANVFCHDKECINLFDEILGDCLLHKNIFQKAFLFYGSGSNGKSTILKLINKLIGADNIATIGLDDLTSRFMPVGLENKLVNLGDDINYRPMRNSGTLKKLFSGEPITVERKNEQAYTIKPYATHIFSCNKLPPNSDKSDGMYRRWCFVPFNAVFNSSSKDYDPLIFEKISTDNALSYLLNRAIKGFKRLSKRGHYLEPKVVQEAKAEYMINNSSVLSWCEDDNISLELLTSISSTELYRMYLGYCSVNNIKQAVSAKSFYGEIASSYKLSDKRKQKADGKRYFTVPLDF